MTTDILESAQVTGKPHGDLRGQIVPINDPRYGEILQLLYEEAEVLDDGRFSDWIALLTADVSYRMPLRLNRRRRSERADYSDETLIYDDDQASLKVRVDRLSTTFAWAEDPPSRTRHLITNLRVRRTANPSELEARTNFLVYRSRLDKPTPDLYSGERVDLIRRVGDAWRIASRRILLDQAVVGATNISVLL